MERITPSTGNVKHFWEDFRTILLSTGNYFWELGAIQEKMYKKRMIGPGVQTNKLPHLIRKA